MADENTIWRPIDRVAARVSRVQVSKTNPYRRKRTSTLKTIMVTESSWEKRRWALQVLQARGEA